MVENERQPKKYLKDLRQEKGWNKSCLLDRNKSLELSFLIAALLMDYNFTSVEVLSGQMVEVFWYIDHLYKEHMENEWFGLLFFMCESV